MPGDNADLAAVQVDFDRLSPDSPEACPVAMTDLLDYLAREVRDGEQLTATDLTFLRTAQVETTEYWVWQFKEPGPDGDDAYATVSRSGNQATLGCDTNYYGLSPEQFILGDYHQVF